MTCGSSPLTRGKLSQRNLSDLEAGLIPAHAGKTRQSRGRSHAKRAHPRSRGENGQISAEEFNEAGSSPLTRGKHGLLVNLQDVAGLIPAHAGKTPTGPTKPPKTAAHPRSRGENCKCALIWARSAGSSPLTRGKRGEGEGGQEH